MSHPDLFLEKPRNPLYDYNSPTQGVKYWNPLFICHPFFLAMNNVKNTIITLFGEAIKEEKGVFSKMA